MAKHAFEKFMKKESSGAKKKEEIRQEKRKAKKERRDKIEESKQRKYESRSQEQDPRFKIQGKKESSNIQHSTPNKTKTQNSNSDTESMPLNKFVAHSGICGRREAAELVKQGKVQVIVRLFMNLVLKFLQKIKCR